LEKSELPVLRQATDGDRLIARAAALMRLGNGPPQDFGARGACGSNGRRCFAPHVFGDADTGHIKRAIKDDSNLLANFAVPFLAAHH
jgi:hypothetical protein